MREQQEKKMFGNIFTKQHWKKQRADNLQAARECKAITGGNGVAFWVKRAKRCHNIVMQREAICEQVLISNELTQGPVWAQ